MLIITQKDIRTTRRMAAPLLQVLMFGATNELSAAVVRRVRNAFPAAWQKVINGVEKHQKYCPTIDAAAFIGNTERLLVLSQQLS